MKGRQRAHKGILTVTLAVLMLASVSVLPAVAAEGSAGSALSPATSDTDLAEETIHTGLTVEKMSFREVLRLYSLDKKTFGTDAVGTDASGATGSAWALASMFTYTVGLNYTGEGKNYDYFGKDITDLMGKEPYAETNLIDAYKVEISPYHGYALARPAGQTTMMYVYRVGYQDTANGIESIYHYVWKEGERYFAVKDDAAYYKVSYNGDNAVTAAEKGFFLFRSEVLKAGTEEVGEWTPLFASSENSAVQLSDSTLLAGDGAAMLFGMTEDADILDKQTGLSPDLRAVSNYAEGSSFCVNGPLICSMEVLDAETMETVEADRCLEQGTKYLFRLEYDESLAAPAEAPEERISVLATAGEVDESAGITDFVWYGSEEYLADVKYEPGRIEFCYTPSEKACDIVTFRLAGLVGETSSLSAADVYAVLPEDPVRKARIVAAAEAETAAADTAVQNNAPASETSAAAVATAEAKTAVPDTAGNTASVKSSTPITRVEAALLLWKYCGSPEVSPSGAFNDLPEDPESVKAISWASGQGFIQGYGNGFFGTYDYISREQCAVILSRVAMKNSRRAATTCTITYCEDVSEVSSWAREAVSWAVQSGCYTLENNYLYPQRTITGAELERMLSGIKLDLNK